jgi:hypothetical protein
MISLNPKGHDLLNRVHEMKTDGCTIGPVLCIPPFWKQYVPHSSISWTWRTLKFLPSNKGQVPDDRHGLYSFIVDPGLANHPHTTLLLYIGKADRMSFRQEFARYFSEIRNMKRLPLCEWLYQCQEHALFSYCSIDDLTLIDAAEKSLTAALCPPANELYDGELNKAIKAFT